ncbi:phage repressor protein CI [Mixta calida]|uniref:Phage repressor protein CI n=1 Tax=Mixta calida TaxID=665913 RepID=A0ABN5HA97_9GAMM|nr:phage repressor protein CI [Mixta calida]AUY25585.1 phage repressor protein CI [Mixta calida]ORM59188.1 repressor [Mixta calida]
MDFSEGTALEIVERLSSAYGVTTQKALAECLGVPAANVSNWVQRDSVPGSAFVKCALDTGSDLHWLTSGKLANANLDTSPSIPKGEALYNEITSNGGKPVLRRIMDAYGFTLQKQLCELLGISSGTVSTWVRRNYFPGDIVVTCALDTGVSLQWLATGKGNQRDGRAEINTDTMIPRKNLAAGILQDAGYLIIDLNFMPQKIVQPLFIYGNTKSWFVDMNLSDISNGRWLLGIDEKYDVYDIALSPGRIINVSNEMTSFTCKIDEVECLAKVILTVDYNF